MFFFCYILSCKELEALNACAHLRLTFLFGNFVNITQNTIVRLSNDSVWLYRVFQKIGGQTYYLRAY